MGSSATSLRHRAAPVFLGLHRLAGLFVRPAAGAVRILLLHDVPPDDEPALVALLQRIAGGDGFVGPDEALTRLREGPRDGRAPVLVTFDDGFSSAFRVAEQVLRPFAARAVFFVCPGLMDLPDDDQPGAVARHVFRGAASLYDLPPPPVLMSWDQTAELVAQGHAIGGHGLTHRRLSSLHGADLQMEIEECADRLQDRLGRPAHWFAFPFGDIDSIGAEALASVATRFTVCRSGIRGINRAGIDPLALRAEQVDLTAPPSWQDLALGGGLDIRYSAARARLDALAAVVGRAR